MEGRLDDAVAALQRATKYKDEQGFPRWTWAWLSGVINRQQGRLAEAATNLRSVIEDDTAETRRRKFDFSKDIQVVNILWQTLFDLGRIRQRQGREQLYGVQEQVQCLLSQSRLQDEKDTRHRNRRDT